MSSRAQPRCWSCHDRGVDPPEVICDDCRKTLDLRKCGCAHHTLLPCECWLPCPLYHDCPGAAVRGGYRKPARTTDVQAERSEP